jgi:hypothetical protein
MQISRRHLKLSAIAAGALAASACEPVRVPAPTVSDLMEDRVALDGALMKCNDRATIAGNEALCSNARIAVDRLAKQNEAAEIAKREEAFERSREQLRQTMEKQRAQQESAKPKIDAYNLPLVPVEPAPPPAASAAQPADQRADLPPPVVGQAR